MAPSPQPVLLMAEDRDDDAFLCELALKRHGVTAPLRRVCDIEEAIRYLTGQGPFSDRSQYPLPFAIISDLDFAHLDGLSFLRWTQTHPQWSQVPVFVLTAYDDAETLRLARQLGAAAVLVKDWNTGEYQRLAACVSHALSQWRGGTDSPPCQPSPGGSCSERAEI